MESEKVGSPALERDEPGEVIRGIHDHDNHLVTVAVNEHPVKILGHKASGLEIKTAAIEQGVHMRVSFILEEDLSDGGHRVVEDHDEVRLHEQLSFTARENQHHTVTVSVNEQPVKLQGHKATGAEIKAAAIVQGVIIQPNFVLQEELPNGTSRIVGDADEVHLREHLRFTAIAPDDNS